MLGLWDARDGGGEGQSKQAAVGACATTWEVFLQHIPTVSEPREDARPPLHQRTPDSLQG